jgi:glycerol kinase
VISLFCRHEVGAVADLVGALDQGTTSTRFIIFDRAGRVVASAQQEHEQIFPRPGWVEHDPAEIIARMWAVIDRALDGAGVVAADLAAVGITNQRETTVVWDRETGRAVGNAIVWQDTRTDGPRAQPREATRVPIDSDIEPGFRSPTYFAGPQGPVAARRGPGARAAGSRRASWPSAPSIRGCCGTSPEGRSMSPTSRTRRARC